MNGSGESAIRCLPTLSQIIKFCAVSVGVRRSREFTGGIDHSRSPTGFVKVTGLTATALASCSREFGDWANLRLGQQGTSTKWENGHGGT